jgi:hypothetical protein
MDYPNDANGDVLRRMEAKGDDFRPRNIDFTVVFADENSAEEFAKHFGALGHTVSVEKTGTSKDLPYDVRVVKHMAPSYDGISNFEDVLQIVGEGVMTAGVVSPGRLSSSA